MKWAMIVAVEYNFARETLCSVSVLQWSLASFHFYRSYARQVTSSMQLHSSMLRNDKNCCRVKTVAVVSCRNVEWMNCVKKIRSYFAKQESNVTHCHTKPISECRLQWSRSKQSRPLLGTVHAVCIAWKHLRRYYIIYSRHIPNRSRSGACSGGITQKGTSFSLPYCSRDSR